MSSIRRRALRTPALGVRAEQLLQQLRAGEVSGTADEIVGAGSLPASWAWAALAKLLERGMIAKQPDGRIRITELGRDRSRRRTKRAA